MEETRPCLAEFHPFKQKTFTFHGYEDESKNYCSSCSYFGKMTIMMFQVLIQSQSEAPTLYGNKTIKLTRDLSHDFLDQAWDKVNKLNKELQNEV